MRMDSWWSELEDILNSIPKISIHDFSASDLRDVADWRAEGANPLSAANGLVDMWEERKRAQEDEEEGDNDEEE